MKVKLLRLTDGKKQWVSLLIDNISVAQSAAQTILGHSLQMNELNAHALYTEGSPFVLEFVGVNTVKSTFKNILKDLYKGKELIMNRNGGYIQRDRVDWEVLETMEFEVGYSANLHTLLEEQNGRKTDIKRIS